MRLKDRESQKAGNEDEGQDAEIGDFASAIAFPPIGDPEPEQDDQVAGADGDEDDGRPSLEERLAAMEESQRQERERFEERERRYQDTIDRLISGNLATRQQQTTTDQDDGPETLPDPIARPKEFKAELSKLVGNTIKSTTAAANSDQDRATRLAALRDDFWKANKELQDYPEFVSFAYQQEAQRLQARGIDPDEGALSDPEGMIQRVGDAARARMQKLGIKLGDSGDAGDEDTSERDAAGDDANGEGESKHPRQIQTANRTGGVSGGTRGKGGGSGKANGKKAQGFVATLKEMQAQSGFF